MTRETLLARLEQRIGYQFVNRAFLEQALTHSSLGGSGLGGSGHLNNERIEFLGDRVLNLIVAHCLFEAFEGDSEGGLAKRHSALVQGRMLAKVAQGFSLGDYIRMSESERHGGGGLNENIVADAMEALLGAVYLDGGLEPARRLVLELWGDAISLPGEAEQDPKTELQEWVQARGLPLPDYAIVGRSGPDHAPLFDVEVRVEGVPASHAEGPSRRHAEKLAATLMLTYLKERT